MIRALRQCDRRFDVDRESFLKKVTRRAMGWWQMKEGERAQPVLGMGREHVGCAGAGGRLEPGML